MNPNCQKEWCATFVMRHYDRDWIRTVFKDHLGRVLLERERMLLPYTQKDARLEREIRDLREQIRRLPRITKLKNTRVDENYLETLIETRSNLMNEMSLRKQECGLYQNSASARVSSSLALPAIVCKCPSTVECRGFITSENYKCGTCGVSICKDCHVIITSENESEHKCCKDDVDSVRIIAAETKQCPKCHVSIYKAGGCDQMFCVQCNMAFSWQTGKLETGDIHNPYYFEWLRNQSHEAGDVLQLENIACGELPSTFETFWRLRSAKIKAETIDKIMFIVRVAGHFEHAVLPGIPTTDRRNDHIDLRVAYLLGELDENGWASKLAHREFRNLKTTAIREICNTTVAVLRDIIRRVLFEPNTNKANNAVREFESFTDIYVKMLRECIDVHGGAIPLHVPTGLSDINI